MVKVFGNKATRFGFGEGLVELGKRNDKIFVLGADTVILFNGKIMGKPENHEQAIKYLTQLQGKTHTVLTALVLYNGREKKTM